MKKTSLAFIAVLMTTVGYSQMRMNLELRSGYGSYMMKDLSKELHYNETIAQQAVPARAVTDFPSWYHYGFNMMASLGDYDAGFGYTYYSTGGRVHYADYSGEVGFQYLTTMHSIALTGQYHFIQNKKFDVSLLTSLSLNFSNMEVSGWSRVGDDEDREMEHFMSRSFGLTVMPGARYYVTSWMYLGARAGVLLDTKGRLRLASNTKLKLVDHNDDPMNTDWTGWRAEMFIGFVLNQKEHNNE